MDLTIVVGASESPALVFRDAAGNEVAEPADAVESWSSSAPDAVAVDAATGKTTCNADPGEAVTVSLSVTLADGAVLTATSTVTVTPAPPPPPADPASVEITWPSSTGDPAPTAPPEATTVDPLAASVAAGTGTN